MGAERKHPVRSKGKKVGVEPSAEEGNMFTEAFDTLDVMDVVPDLTPAPPDAYAPGPGGPYDDDVPDFADDGIATPAEKAWYKWKHGKNAHGAALGETAATREGDPAMMEVEANSEKSHSDKRTAKQGKSACRHRQGGPVRHRHERQDALRQGGHPRRRPGPDARAARRRGPRARAGPRGRRRLPRRARL